MCYFNYQQDNWAELIHYTQFAYNNSEQSAIHCSPLFANNGVHPRANHVYKSETSGEMPAVTNMRERLQKNQGDITLSLWAAKKRK